MRNRRLLQKLCSNLLLIRLKGTSARHLSTGFTGKKTFGYERRSEGDRDAFRKRIAELDPQRIVYVDESGFDNASRVEYGYSPKGKRCLAMKPGRATE